MRITFTLIFVCYLLLLILSLSTHSFPHVAADEWGSESLPEVPHPGLYECANDSGSFNNSVSGQKVHPYSIRPCAVEETVARFVAKNDSNAEKSFQFHDVFDLDNENRAEDTPTLIDQKDNVFIISKPKSKYPVLRLDPRLISDLVVVIVSATCGGVAFASAGQPVETVAQFGVIFLLFALGLEFSTKKLRFVQAVAVLGGLLQIFLYMCLCGIIASLCGAKPSEGIFVGVLLSMSSTAVVTIGLLILQDCAVGLLFALLPVLGGSSGVLQGVISMTKSLMVLMTFLATLTILSSTCIQRFLKLMISLSSQTNEIYQLASVAFCLLVAWVGMPTAQIGEFTFVLLNCASNLHLVEGKVYLLLLGTTALSLVTTPLLFKLIPAVVHLGVLLRWFPPDSPIEIGYKGDSFCADSAKHVALMVHDDHDS